MSTRTGLERHIVWEDALLFPLFEAATGMRESSPTAVMRSEHQEIGACLDVIEGKLAVEAADLVGEEDRLLNLLSLHNWKEEAVVYPLLDQQLTTAEREQLFQQMSR